MEDGCGRMTDEAAAAPSKRRRSQKRDKATNNNDNRQYTTIKQNTVEVGGRHRPRRKMGKEGGGTYDNRG